MVLQEFLSKVTWLDYSYVLPFVFAKGGGKGSVPKMPPPPPPPVTPPPPETPPSNTEAKAAAAEAKSRERRRAQAGSMNKTLATSPEGVLGTAPTSAPALKSNLG